MFEGADGEGELHPTSRRPEIHLNQDPGGGELDAIEPKRSGPTVNPRIDTRLHRRRISFAKGEGCLATHPVRVLTEGFRYR